MHKVMQRLFIILLILSLEVAFVCEEVGEPKLSIELSDEYQSISQCKLHFVTLPREFNESDFRSAVFVYEDETEVFRFSLEFRWKNEEGTILESPFCIDNEKLFNSTLEVTYKPKPNSDGSISLCIDSYKYQDLSTYVTKE